MEKATAQFAVVIAAARKMLMIVLDTFGFWIHKFIGTWFDSYASGFRFGRHCWVSSLQFAQTCHKLGGKSFNHLNRLQNIQLKRIKHVQRFQVPTVPALPRGVETLDFELTIFHVLSRFRPSLRLRLASAVSMSSPKPSRWQKPLPTLRADLTSNQISLHRRWGTKRISKEDHPQQTCWQFVPCRFFSGQVSVNMKKIQKESFGPKKITECCVYVVCMYVICFALLGTFLASNMWNADRSLGFLSYDLSPFACVSSYLSLQNASQNTVGAAKWPIMTATPVKAPSALQHR